ncbi:MAG: ribosome small subunit-dependent GTPase A [Chlorobiaceae bacterium]|nr:ribosome small subunit-dependent GTPase A [Chlorobiaceae bacterium]
MNIRQTKLAELGWNEWFEERATCRETGSIARVAAVDRQHLLLVDMTGTFRAKLAGSYLHRHPEPEELLCVGDWVCFHRPPGSDFGVIDSLIERRTSLQRKRPGHVTGYQMIAANVDTVIIVQSCHFDFNLKRLERYLVMVAKGGAEPCILLTKTDLVEPALMEEQMESIRAAGIKAPILTLSNVTAEGVKELEELMLPGKTYCFVGSSGVGKSTLINHLTGKEGQATAAVSHTGEGRHTSVRRELIRLEEGALVIDNPGMREFGVIGAESGISQSYGDIEALAARCRYSDCTHTNEPECAISKALDDGLLQQEHLDHYQKLLKESEFHEMSYEEKRKKDRAFGKHKQAFNKSRKLR